MTDEVISELTQQQKAILSEIEKAIEKKNSQISIPISWGEP